MKLKAFHRSRNTTDFVVDILQSQDTMDLHLGSQIVVELLWLSSLI